MSDCLFCKMVAGEIQPDVVMETESVLAFRDLNPQAPTHLLVIPKQHISTLNDVTPENQNILGEMTHVAKVIAEREGLSDRGYRLVMNCNEEAGQTVFHIHMHVLGGRVMHWPPG